MPGTVERSNYRLGAPKVAGIGFGEYGNERFQAMDTTGGSSPLGSMLPAVPDLQPQGLGNPLGLGNQLGEANPLGNMPLTRAEFFHLTGTEL